MASSAQLRLMSDLKAIRNEPPEGCSASPYGDENLFVWSATVFGPEDSPWEGGIFSLRLIFGEHYPEKPPRVRFTSEVYHPNVYSDGTLCMDIIQDAWSPCHNVSTILTSIQSLLTDPNPSSPANPEAAHLFQTDMKAYNRKLGTVECFSPEKRLRRISSVKDISLRLKDCLAHEPLKFIKGIGASTSSMITSRTDSKI